MRKLLSLFAILLVHGTSLGAAGGGGTIGGGGGLRSNPAAVDLSRLSDIAKMALEQSYSSHEEFTDKMKALSGGLVLEDGTKVTIVGRHHGEYVIQFKTMDNRTWVEALRVEEMSILKFD